MRKTKSIKFSVRISSSSVIILISIIVKDEVLEIDDLIIKSTVKSTSFKIIISTSDSLSVKIVSKISVFEKLRKSQLFKEDILDESHN